MATRSEVLDPDDPAWLRFVEAHPDRLPFHHPGWLRTLAACYGFRPFVVAVSDGRQAIAGGIPLMEVRGPLQTRRWIALPFTDRCPPLLATPGDEERVTAALRSAAAAAGVSRLELHAPMTGLPGSAIAVEHRLDLSAGTEALDRGFSSAARRGARKARREGIVVRRGEVAADLVESYYALHLRTRRRLGVPVQPRRFFRELWQHLLEPGLGHVLLAFSDGVPVAGAVFLHAGRTVIYKYGASDEHAWSLRPNNALFAEAIRWSVDAGYAELDFGRSDVTDTGLRAFKAGWGATELPLVYSGWPAVRASASDSAGRMLGGVIRRSPPAVCRAIGESLYRFAA